MPTHPAGSALTKAYFLGGCPWIWPTWQKITGVKHGLFPADDALLPKGWTRQHALDIQSYFHQYSLVSTDELKIKFASNSNKHVPGRTKWNSWISSNWEVWDVHTRIVEGLRQHSIHPISLIVSSGDTDTWPNSSFYIPIALDTIGMSLFGPEPFGDSDLLPPEIRPILTAMIQRSWARIREQVITDRKKLVDTEVAALKAFDGTLFHKYLVLCLTIVIAELSEGKLTKAKVMKCIRNVSKWKNISEIYATKVNVSKADDMLSELNRLLTEMGAKVSAVKPGSGKSASVESIPSIDLTLVLELVKANEAALKDLATEEEVLQLVRIYQEYFDPIDDENDDVPVLATTEDESITMQDVGGGDLGVEIEARINPDILANRLGFLKGRIPHQFNPHRHRKGLTAWDSPELFVDDDSPLPDSLTPIFLHWHQLVGVHSIVRNSFTKKPSSDHCTGTLICDEVGLGKTAQAIAMIAFMNQVVLLQQGGQPLPPILRNYHYSYTNHCNTESFSQAIYHISKEQTGSKRYLTSL
jgi:TATA-binding protein-associated factor